DIHHRDVPRHAATLTGTPPVGVLDLDLTRIDDPADDGDMAKPHTSVRAEGQDAAILRHAAARVDTGRIVPPLPGVTGYCDAGIVACERYAGNATPSGILPATGRGLAVSRGMQSTLDGLV